MVGGYLKWFEATSNPLHIVHIGFWESTVCGKAIVFPGKEMIFVGPFFRSPLVILLAVEVTFHLIGVGIHRDILAPSMVAYIHEPTRCVYV